MSDQKRMWKEAGILFAITLIAGLLLGFIYELTKEPIRQQKELAVKKACQAVFEKAGDFEVIEYAPAPEIEEELFEKGVTIGQVRWALSADKTVLGYVVETTSSQGYGGNITLYVGITKEGVLNGVSILSILETPGLGMRAEEVLVPQFAGKKAVEFYYTKSGSISESEIDAISGATITTKAVTNAVNGAVKVVCEDLEKGGE